MFIFSFSLLCVRRLLRAKDTLDFKMSFVRFRIKYSNIKQLFLKFYSTCSFECRGFAGAVRRRIGAKAVMLVKPLRRAIIDQKRTFKAESWNQCICWETTNYILENTVKKTKPGQTKPLRTRRVYYPGNV